MSDYGTPIGADAVRFERILPGPIERVWEYLTKSEQRGTWLASGSMEPRLGGAVELRFRHADLHPHVEETPERYKKYDKGSTLLGRITRWEPPRVLAYTWGDEGRDPGQPATSEVTFELTPRGGDVVLVLTHRRLASREEMVNVSAGWHTHLALLGDRLSGIEPKAFWTVLARLEKEYEDRFAAGS
jgi:uncharacterized protein YndB with AHSA1/START domain